MPEHLPMPRDTEATQFFHKVVEGEVVLAALRLNRHPLREPAKINDRWNYPELTRTYGPYVPLWQQGFYRGRRGLQVVSYNTERWELNTGLINFVDNPIENERVSTEILLKTILLSRVGFTGTMDVSDLTVSYPTLPVIRDERCRMRDELALPPPSKSFDPFFDSVTFDYVVDRLMQHELRVGTLADINPVSVRLY